MSKLSIFLLGVVIAVYPRHDGLEKVGVRDLMLPYVVYSQAMILCATSEQINRATVLFNANSKWVNDRCVSSNP